MSKQFHPFRQGGFTLVEAVIVIVITGIVASMVAIFIRAPIQSYMDSRDRADLTEEANSALRRIRLDLRLALPNSIRIGTDASGFQYLELLLTNTGGRYQDVNDGLGVAGSLSFTDSTKNYFNYIGSPFIDVQAIVPGNSIVVNNMGDGYSPDEAYEGKNRALVTGVALVTDVENKKITIATSLINPANPFALSDPSPNNRFQAIVTPVTYRCAAASPTGGAIVRYWDYKIQTAQPTSVASLATPDDNRPAALPKNAQLTGDLTLCNFDYSTTASTIGLVGLRFSLAKVGGNGGIVTLFDQVHVDNTP